MRFLPIIALICLFAACAKDQVRTVPDICDTNVVTYTNTAMSIVNSYCSFSGCHDGEGGTDFGDRLAPFDFRTYEGLRHVLDNGQFERHVITLRGDSLAGMPPLYTGIVISDIEYDLLKCWIDQGFPE